jgi:hypothetical protein
MFQDSFAVAVATARTPRIPVISTDPDVGATVGILLSVPYCSAVSQRAAVHVSDRYGYGDHLTESTSKSNELSNPNAFCGGSLF